MKSNRAGFTFIELLITLVVFAIAFLPLMNMFSVSLEQAAFNSDLTTARYLAQEGMERMKNLNFTEAQLVEAGEVWDPPLETEALLLNGKKWRVLRKPMASKDPLEVTIQVFREAELENNQGEPVVELVTLYEDFDWPLGQ